MREKKEQKIFWITGKTTLTDQCFMMVPEKMCVYEIEKENNKKYN